MAYPNSTHAYLLVTRGLALINLGDNKATMRAFKKAAELDPKSARPLAGEVTAALRNGDAVATLQPVDRRGARPSTGRHGQVHKAQTAVTVVYDTCLVWLSVTSVIKKFAQEFGHEFKNKKIFRLA